MSEVVGFQGFECDVEVGQYANGRPAIQLYDVEDGLPVATATVNLVAVSDAQIRRLAEQAGADPRRVTFVKNWSENYGMCAALVPPAPLRGAVPGWPVWSGDWLGMIRQSPRRRWRSWSPALRRTRMEDWKLQASGATSRQRLLFGGMNWCQEPVDIHNNRWKLRGFSAKIA